jgi:hypothetical protein
MFGRERADGAADQRRASLAFPRGLAGVGVRSRRCAGLRLLAQISAARPSVLLFAPLHHSECSGPTAVAASAIPKLSARPACRADKRAEIARAPRT